MDVTRLREVLSGRRSRPTRLEISPSLVALADRINAARPNFLLNTPIIGQPDIAPLFRTLLLQAGPALPLSGATEPFIDDEDDSLFFEAQCEVFGALLQLDLLFAAESDGSVSLVIGATHTWGTLGALYGGGIIPAPTVLLSPAALENPVPYLEMVFDSQFREVRVKNDTPVRLAWDIGLPADVGLELLTVNLRIRAESAERPRAFEPRFGMNLRPQPGLNIPVDLDVPTGVLPWALALTRNSIGPYTLANLAPLLGGTAAGLPPSLQDRPYNLADLSLLFTPAAPGAWTLWLGLMPYGDPAWAPIPELPLSLRRTQVEIQLAGTGGFAAGSLGATFSQGVNYPVNGAVSLRSGAATWTFAAAPEVEVDLMALAPLLGGTARVADTLEKLGNPEETTLSSMAVRFSNVLLGARVQATAEISEVPKKLSWTSGHDRTETLTYGAPDDPATADVDGSPTFGEIVAYATPEGYSVKDALIPMVLYADSSQASTVLRLAESSLGRVPALGALATVITADEVAANSPPGMRLDGPVQIYALELVFDASGNVTKRSIELGFVLSWLVLDGAFGLYGRTLTIPASGPAWLTAAIPVLDTDWQLTGSADDWLLSGQLVTQEIDEAAPAPQPLLGFLKNLVDPQLAFPVDVGFPVDVLVQTGVVEFEPRTPKMSFFFGLFETWTFPFAANDYALANLLGLAENTGGDAPSVVGGARGDFTAAGLMARPTCWFGAGPVVLAGPANVEQLDLPAFVDLLCRATGPDLWGTVPIASGTALPAFDTAEAALRFDLTAGLCRLDRPAPTEPGTYDGVGLLVHQATPGGSWSFLLAGALANGWTLSAVQPDLAPLQPSLGASVVAGTGAIVVSPEDDVVPAVLADVTTPALLDRSVTRGVQLVGQLSFTGALYDRIPVLLDLQGAGPFTVSGVIRVPPIDSTFDAVLVTAPFLGAVVLSDPIVRAAAATPERLAVTGALVVPIGDQTSTFTGAFDVEATTATWATSRPAGTLSTPLGATGIDISAPIAVAGMDFGTGERHLEVAGTASWPNGAEPAWVLFDDGGRAVVTLATLGRIGLDEVFARCAGAGSWPAALPILTLDEGQLAMALEAVDLTSPITGANEPFIQGYRGKGTAELSFLGPAAVSFVIHAGVGMEVRAAARAALDWQLVRLENPDDATEGPLLTMDTSTGACDLVARVILFGTDLGTQPLDRGEDELTATVLLPPSAGVFAGLTVVLRWQPSLFSSNGWVLTDTQWPDLDFRDLTTPGCPQGPINQLPTNEETEFDGVFAMRYVPVTAGAAAKAGDVPGQLTIELEGVFEIPVVAAGRATETLQAPLARSSRTTTPPAPDRYRWGDLEADCDVLMEEKQDDIFGRILEDGQSTSNLGAADGAEWTQANAQSWLQCRGRDPAEAEALTATGSIIVPTTVELPGCGPIVVGGAPIVLVGGFAASGPTVRVGLRDFGLPARRSGSPPAPPAPPVVFVNGGTIGLSFPDVPNSGAYGLLMQNTATGTYVPFLPAVAGSPMAIPLLMFGTALPVGIAYRFWLMAYGPGGDSPLSAPIDVYILQTPEDVVAEFVDEHLAARWTDLDTATFEVRATRDGVVVSLEVRIDQAARTATLGGPGILGGGTFVVEVRAVDASNQTVWVASNPVAVLAAPTGLSIGLADRAIVFQFATVPGATDYQVELLDGLLVPGGWSTTVRLTIGDTWVSGTIEGDGIDDGSRRAYRARGVASGVAGAAAVSPVIDVVLLPAPDAPRVTYDDASETVYVTWTADPAGSTGEPRLLDASGQPVDPQPPFSPRGDGTSATLDASALADGVWQVDVRYVLPANTGPWSLATPFEKRAPLPIPTGLVLVERGGDIVATWNPVAIDGVVYEVEVADVTAGTAPERLVSPVASASIPGVVADDTYEVRVRCVFGEQVGGWCAPARITVLGPPAASAWPTFGASPRRAGCLDVHGPATWSESWRTKLNVAGPPSGPTEAPAWPASLVRFRDTVVVATTGGLAGLDAATGALTWLATLPAAPSSPSVTADDGLVCVTSATEATLWAVSSDASTLALGTLPGSGAPSPVVDGLDIAAATSGDFSGCVAGFSASVPAWRWPAEGVWVAGASGPVARDGDTLYVLGLDQALYAIAASTGQTRWRRYLGSFGTGCPSVAPDGRVWVALAGGEVCTVSPEGVVSRATLPGAFGYGSPVAHGPTLSYVQHGNGLLTALDGSLQVRWQVAVDMDLRPVRVPSPTLDGSGLVFAASESGALTAIEAATGAIVWIARFERAIRTPILDEQGHLYVVTADGTVVCGAGGAQWTLAQAAQDAASRGEDPIAAAPRLFDEFPQSTADQMGAALVQAWSPNITREVTGAALAACRQPNGARAYTDAQIATALAALFALILQFDVVCVDVAAACATPWHAAEVVWRTSGASSVTLLNLLTGEQYPDRPANGSFRFQAAGPYAWRLLCNGANGSESADATSPANLGTVVLSSGGKYLVVQPDGRVALVGSDPADPNARYQLVMSGPSEFTLKASNGKWLSFTSMKSPIAWYEVLDYAGTLDWPVRYQTSGLNFSARTLYFHFRSESGADVSLMVVQSMNPYCQCNFDVAMGWAFGTQFGVGPG